MPDICISNKQMVCNLLQIDQDVVYICTSPLYFYVRA